MPSSSPSSTTQLRWRASPPPRPLWLTQAPRCAMVLRWLDIELRRVQPQEPPPFGVARSKPTDLGTPRISSSAIPAPSRIRPRWSSFRTRRSDWPGKQVGVGPHFSTERKTALPDNNEESRFRFCLKPAAQYDQIHLQGKVYLGSASNGKSHDLATPLPKSKTLSLPQPRRDTAAPLFTLEQGRSLSTSRSHIEHSHRDLRHDQGQAVLGTNAERRRRALENRRMDSKTGRSSQLAQKAGRRTDLHVPRRDDDGRRQCTPCPRSSQ